VTLREPLSPPQADRRTQSTRGGRRGAVGWSGPRGGRWSRSRRSFTAQKQRREERLQDHRPVRGQIPRVWRRRKGDGCGVGDPARRVAGAAEGLHGKRIGADSFPARLETSNLGRLGRTRIPESAAAPEHCRPAGLRQGGKSKPQLRRPGRAARAHRHRCRRTGTGFGRDRRQAARRPGAVGARRGGASWRRRWTKSGPVRLSGQGRPAPSAQGEPRTAGRLLVLTLRPALTHFRRDGF